MMLAWDMRLGKTATALRAWDEIAHEGPLLVICPATARAVWQREANRWCSPGTRVQVMWNAAARCAADSDVVITNYDLLGCNAAFMDLLRERGRRPVKWGALVLDEAHYLKNPTAKRTMECFGYLHGSKAHGQGQKKGLIERAKPRVWELTGTPMPNHPAELWSHCRALWPDAIMWNGHPMELWEFELRYCQLMQTDHGMKVVGGKNLGELKKVLSPYIHRLKAPDVMPHNKLLIETWPLDVGKTKVYANLPQLVASLQQRFGEVGQIETWGNQTVDEYLRAINAEYDAVAKVRHEVGTLKAIGVSLLVREEIENGAPKTIVFAHHREAIETLAKGLASCNVAVIHGGTSAKQRTTEIERFQTDPTCRVFVGQLKAAGEAIDLSAAEHIVFAEASFVPGENAQAMARASGPNQKAPVWVRYSYLAGSIDENVMRACARKTEMINQVL